ncbi:MAG: hypothetical protein ACP5JG_03430 [Anaerolineae bacterium]
MKTRDFWQWFEEEMARQGFRSVRQVERAGDVGNDTISSRYRREAEPTDTVIRAIARAFDMSFEDVQNAASGEPPESSELPPVIESANLTLRELWGIVSELPVADQRAVLDYALYRRSKSEQPGDDRSSPATAANERSPAASDGGA